MKKIALITTLAVSGTMQLHAGEVARLKASNSQKNQQIDTLEKEIDHLYKLLDKQNKDFSKKGSSNLNNGSMSGVYKVVSGDSLSKIARQHKVSLAVLMKTNGLDHSSVLRIGQKLKVPTSQVAKTASAKPVVKKTAQAAKKEEFIPKATVVMLPEHTVASGDTFYGIARRYRVSVSALKAANPRLKPSSLRIGQKITLPHGSKPTVASNSSTPKKKTTSKPNTGLHTVKQVPINNTPVRKKSYTTVATQPEVMKSVYLDKPIKFKDLAKKYNTSVKALNELNDWSYPGNITLAKGSEIYLPN